MSLIITVRPEAVFTVHTHPCDNKSLFVSSHSGVTVTFRSSMSGCTKSTQTHTDAHTRTYTVCVCLLELNVPERPGPAPNSPWTPHSSGDNGNITTWGEGSGDRKVKSGQAGCFWANIPLLTTCSHTHCKYFQVFILHCQLSLWIVIRVKCRQITLLCT